MAPRVPPATPVVDHVENRQPANGRLFITLLTYEPQTYRAAARPERPLGSGHLNDGFA